MQKLAGRRLEKRFRRDAPDVFLRTMKLSTSHGAALRQLPSTFRFYTEIIPHLTATKLIFIYLFNLFLLNPISHSLLPWATVMPVCNSSLLCSYKVICFVYMFLIYRNGIVL